MAIASQSTSQSAFGSSTTKIRSTVDAVTSNQAVNVGREIGNSKIDDISSELSQADMMQTVRMIGGAMIGIAVLIVVLNEVFSLQSIGNTTGPFSGVIDSLETTGGAALGLIVVGLLIAGANRVMSFFGGGGF